LGKGTGCCPFSIWICRPAEDFTEAVHGEQPVDGDPILEYDLINTTGNLHTMIRSVTHRSGELINSINVQTITSR